MQRMEGEKPGHEGRTPAGARQITQYCKEQYGIQQVKEYAGEVVTSGVIDPVEFDVQHMGQPGERVPVRFGECGERPDRIGCGKATLDRDVLGDVPVVVRTHEIETQCLRKHPPGRESEGNGDRQIGKCDGPAAARIVLGFGFNCSHNGFTLIRFRRCGQKKPRIQLESEAFLWAMSGGRSV